LKKIIKKTKSITRIFVVMISVLLPWKVRRNILEKVMGYNIHSTCKIGFSWVFPKKLIMKSHAKISHFTVIKGLEKLYLGQYSIIGKGNWISGYTVNGLKHYENQCGRKSELIIGEHSAVTNAHIIDCTNSVTIGHFTTIAGYGSQIITHSIDLDHCRQWSETIKIGDYCFIGTNTVILGGSSLPSYSVLGAKSLLNKSYSVKYLLFTGVPAMPKKNLPHSLGYFNRKEGYIL
jgi:acetyltransferase-like isoleucine patch superfamily enzyme